MESKGGNEGVKGLSRGSAEGEANDDRVSSDGALKDVGGNGALRVAEEDAVVMIAILKDD